MAQFLALTSGGLVDVLEEELHGLGLTKTRKAKNGVHFESNWQGCYLANLALRSSTRVLMPVLDFPAYQPDDIYHNVKKHDFTKYLSLNQKFAVESSVYDSKIKDQRIVALKAKDAIADLFRDKTGERPDVDKKSPDVTFVVKISKNQVTVAIDTSGEPLFKRGYRLMSVDAPLKEHMAAGLLMMSDWNREVPVVDLMCGSGTFLIEATMMALNMAPASERKKFSFMNFNTYKKEEFHSVVDEVMAKEKPELSFQFYGFDEDRKAVQAARKNVEAAGLSDYIQIERRSVAIAENPLEEGNGMLVLNPPYGERLGNVEVLKDVYRDLSFSLRTHFKGWNLWLLSGHPELVSALKMKSERKFPVRNGPIDCRWMKYRVF